MRVMMSAIAIGLIASTPARADTATDWWEIASKFNMAQQGAGMPGPLMDWINQYGRNDHFPQTPPGIYTGLGLLIVMELLQLINGRMVVSRNAPEGTTVVLTLQIVR